MTIGDRAPIPPEATTQVPPGPVPVATGVQTCQLIENGTIGHRVIVEFQTPQGISVFFLSPDHAKILAAQLAQNASAASSGLVLPDGRAN